MASHTPTPNRTDFMDDDMKRLWRGMDPLPGGLRLYGETAMAAYLGHRRSTDFDFATPSPVVDLSLVASIPWLRGARLNGGPGMVDAVVEGENRDVSLTFMECGRMVPMPTMDPPTATNGVAVAHPVDIAAAKMEACFTRGALRDYIDVAAAIHAWPAWSKRAGGILPGRRPDAVVRVLSTPPADIEAALDVGDMRWLRSFALSIGRDTGFSR